MSGKRKKDPVHEGCPDTRTTIRAKVTPDEHEAVRQFAKYRCDTTIEDVVRQAVDAYIAKFTGKSLAELAEENRNRGKIVQETLF